MSERRFDLATAVCATGAVVSTLGVLTKRRRFAALGAAAAVTGAIMANTRRDEVSHLEERITSMNEQIRQLETAVATQVQGRIAAENAVRSLTEELSADRRPQERSPQVVDEGSVTRNESLMDPTTGLFTADYFRVTMESRIAAAKRHLRPVAVAIVDVVDGAEDGAAADPSAVASALSETLRESDTATRLEDGRYGLVLEDTPENGAIWTVERVRRQLRETHPDITMWAGVACYPAHAFDVDAIIERAEKALDAAKDWNQDRIEVATAD